MSDLNPGIRRTVQFLNDHGFTTTDSGDGKTHDFGCDRSYPYVVIVTSPEEMLLEARRLKKTLSDAGIEVEPISAGHVPPPQIVATYDPANESAIIELLFLDDALLYA